MRPGWNIIGLLAIEKMNVNVIHGGYVIRNIFEAFRIL